MLLAVDSDKDLIDLESVAIAAALSLESPCIEGTEFVAPQVGRLSVDGDPTFSEEIFIVSVALVESILQPNCAVDDISWESMALIGIHDQIVSFRRINLAIPKI